MANSLRKQSFSGRKKNRKTAEPKPKIDCNALYFIQYLLRAWGDFVPIETTYEHFESNRAKYGSTHG